MRHLEIDRKLVSISLLRGVKESRGKEDRYRGLIGEEGGGSVNWFS